MAKEHPDLNPVAASEEALQVDLTSKDLTESDGIGQFLQEFKGKIEEAVSDRAQWSRKLQLAYMRRRGMLGKEDKNFPFAKSSDLRYPIEEMKIREKRGGYVAVLWNAPKMVRYSPVTPQAAGAKDRLEHFNNFLYRQKIPRFYFNAAATADKLLESGCGYIKVTWEHKTEWRTTVLLKEDFEKLVALVQQQKQQELQQAAMLAQKAGVEPPEMPAEDDEPDTEDLIFMFAKLKNIDLEEHQERKTQIESALKQWREGKKYITFLDEVVTAHQPAVQHIQENQSVVFPSTSSTLQDSEWVGHEMFYTEREMRQEDEENGGRFRHDSVEKLFKAMEHPVAEMLEDKREMLTQREAAEGIKGHEDFEGQFRVMELYCWVPRKYISRFIEIGGDDELPVRAVVTFCPDVDPEQVPPLRVIEFPYEHGEWPIHRFDYNYTIDRAFASRGICELIEPFAREYCTSSNAAIDRHTLTLSPPTLAWDQAGLQPNAFRQVGQFMETQVPPAQALWMPEYRDLSRGFEFDAEKCMRWIDNVIGTSPLSNVAGKGDRTAQEVQALSEPGNSIDNYEHTTWLLGWNAVFRQVNSLCKQYWFLLEDTFTFARQDSPTEWVTIKREDFANEYIITAGGDPSKENPRVEFEKYYTALQIANQFPLVTTATKAYPLIQSVYTKLLGYAEATEVLQPPQIAEQLTQQAQQMAAKNLQAQMEGKRPGRSPRIKQVQGTGGGLPK